MGKIKTKIMNRSSFLKSLVGLMMAPKILLDVEQVGGGMKYLKQRQKRYTDIYRWHLDKSKTKFEYIPEETDYYKNRIFYFDSKGRLLYSKSLT